jgi:hypothetical protein
MFHKSPQKLRKIMRFSTWKYVVEKKLAMGQTLYESKMRPSSSWKCVSNCVFWQMHGIAYITEVLYNKRHRLMLHEPHQDEEHGLIQQCAHRDAVCKPFPEDIPPVSDYDVLHHHLLILSILLEYQALLLFSRNCTPLLLHCLPARERAFQPTLPVEIDGCSEHDHKGELEEEDAVEHEGLGLVPCFQPLCDDVRAGVDCERGETGDCDGWELHNGDVNRVKVGRRE